MHSRRPNAKVSVEATSRARRRVFILLVFATALVAVAPAANAQCKTLEIATLADFKGTWEDPAYHRNLKKNDLICSDSRVKRLLNSSASAQDFVLLQLRDDKTQPTLLWDCARHLGCETPVDLSLLVRVTERNLKGLTRLQSFGQWMEARRYKADSVITKGSASKDLGVLRTFVMVGGKPILAKNAFHSAAPRRAYYLDFCQDSSQDYCERKAPVATSVMWSGDGAAVLPFGNMSAGVHLLYRLENDDSHQRTSDHAIIIAVGNSTGPDLLSEANDLIDMAALSATPSDPTSVVKFDDYVRSMAASLVGGR